MVGLILGFYTLLFNSQLPCVVDFFAEMGLLSGLWFVSEPSIYNLHPAEPQSMSDAIQVPPFVVSYPSFGK